MTEEIEGLEHHADLGAKTGKVFSFLGKELTVNVDVPAVDGLEAVDRPAQRRFARTGGTENDDDLTGGNIEVDVLQGLEVPEVLVHPVQLNHLLCLLNCHRQSLLSDQPQWGHQNGTGHVTIW
jgi:hypothetical protein